MLKVVLNDLLVNLKKNWISILFFIVALILWSIYVVLLANSENGINFNEIRVITEKNLILLLPIINVNAFIYLSSITKKIPLRLSRAMFVCAAGEKEKMKYIYLQLAVKIIFSFLFILGTSYLITGRVFVNQGLGLNIIQLILWFFIILNINLKIGIGEEGLRKKDIEDYIIYSKEEEIVNYYWVCLLILEAVVFYTLYFLKIPLNILGIIGWTVVFIINLYIVYGCITPILKKSLSYEDVYRQIPQMKEGFQ